jgi:folate-dependent phosphoribosylglycinamide formyltransferase PurN
MLARLEEARVDFVLLAGYLRLMPRPVVERFQGRMLNLHPALLPGFGGKGMYGRRVHEAVLASGARLSGATIHFVDEEYDRGRILAQWPVPVLSDDTPESLYARIQEVEHALYPAAVDALARALRDGVDPSAIPSDGRHFHLANGRPDPR